ncbi:MAG: response regulator [Prochloraceae cyanobacterium]
MNTIATNLKTSFDRELNSLKQKQFTGELTVKSSQNLEWKIYLCLGRLVWIDGGYHPHRSWLRALAKYCPKIQLNKTIITIAKKYQCWNYRILTSLFQNKKISKEQFRAIVETKISEAIFDILQQEKTNSLDYLLKETAADYLLDCGLKVSHTLIDIDTILRKIDKSQQMWSQCCQQKHDCWSPNLAPNIKNLERLKQEVSDEVYQNFVKLIDGRYTLRDLAIKLDRDLQPLTYSLVPYIEKGLLELKEVSDLPQNIVSFTHHKNLSNNPAIDDPSKPLIVCIDDSPQILKIMEHIINKKGYRFIGIQQSLKAIPTLIASNPDLIFLDIGMPIVNGYEICTQIRKISKLKDKPVVMLTGQDGIVDRVKAKVAGTSEFITKPIEISKIVAVMEQFLASAELAQVN